MRDPDARCTSHRFPVLIPCNLQSLAGSSLGAKLRTAGLQRPRSAGPSRLAKHEKLLKPRQALQSRLSLGEPCHWWTQPGVGAHQTALACSEPARLSLRTPARAQDLCGGRSNHAALWRLWPTSMRANIVPLCQQAGTRQDPAPQRRSWQQQTGSGPAGPHLHVPVSAQRVRAPQMACRQQPAQHCGRPHQHLLAQLQRCHRQQPHSRLQQHGRSP